MGAEWLGPQELRVTVDVQGTVVTLRTHAIRQGLLWVVLHRDDELTKHTRAEDSQRTINITSFVPADRLQLRKEILVVDSLVPRF